MRDPEIEIVDKSKEIPHMDLKDFHEFGFLQEINRRILHPCGVALEMKVDEDGTYSFGGVWDYRDDPEGITFAPGLIDEDKVRRVYREQAKHAGPRVKLLGYAVQPAFKKDDDESNEDS